MRRRGAGVGAGVGGGCEGDGSGQPGPLAATTRLKTELPAGMRAMTLRRRTGAHAASWHAAVAVGATLVSLAVVVILSVLWSPARELRYE